MRPDVFLTVDVEWSHPQVLQELVQALDERGLPATFFCTHPGIQVGEHERGLHPNFRRNGQPAKALRQRLGDEAYLALDDLAFAEQILNECLSFAPEARGLRTHSLFFASEWVPLYAQKGLVYDCSYLLHRHPGLGPVAREHDLWLLPTFYMDHAEILQRHPDFGLEGLGLERPGLKIFDFHPNMVYLNVASDEHYQAARSYYHQPQRLLENRRPGAGVGSFFLRLLDWAAAHPQRVGRLGAWREGLASC